ncbi:hypothetical protein [Streptomyces sp. AVP053U2]|uniref:hypothetical protein n=1 Tax=Streptomyces sp. AVP053U2 TaxID=1737066 RepID=UPI00073BBB59|nr:hypothetical protein [Streptomyces sp. AVP053U2]ODA69514.1 hypothetical protein APS67_006318 [Streptomyces sp. AVP053U2]
MRTSIPFAAVAAFIEQLGAELNETAAVTIGPNCVTVTEYRRDEDGRRFAVGDHPATTTTEIRIERSTS